jgi:hypothetical protein
MDLRRVRHERLLAGDGRRSATAPSSLGVGGSLANAHVHDDLLKARDLHDVAVVELLLQLVADLVVVLLLEAGHVLLFCHVHSLDLGGLRAGFLSRTPWAGIPRSHFLHRETA